MPKVYPPKVDLFLIADALRQEVGGKVTIMGAFSGGRIVFGPDTIFPVGLPLAFFAAFQEGEGTFKLSVSVKDPAGQELLPKADLNETTKTTGDTLQLMVNFNVFVFPAVGKYQVEL